MNLEVVQYIFEDQVSAQKVIYLSGWARNEIRLELWDKSGDLFFAPKLNSREDLEPGDLEFSGFLIVPGEERSIVLSSLDSTLKIDLSSLKNENNIQKASDAIIQLFKSVASKFLQKDSARIVDWLSNSYLPLARNIKDNSVTKLEITNIRNTEAELGGAPLILLLSNLWELLGYFVLASEFKRCNLICMVPHKIIASEISIFENLAKCYGVSLSVISNSKENILEGLGLLRSKLGWDSVVIMLDQGLNFKKYELLSSDYRSDNAFLLLFSIELEKIELFLKENSFLGDFLSSHIQIALLANYLNHSETEKFLEGRIRESVKKFEFEELVFKIVNGRE